MARFCPCCIDLGPCNRLRTLKLVYDVTADMRSSKASTYFWECIGASLLVFCPGTWDFGAGYNVTTSRALRAAVQRYIRAGTAQNSLN